MASSSAPCMQAFLNGMSITFMASSVPPRMQVHKMLFRMRAEELTSAVEMEGYHVRDDL
jgi:hypothetical protein